MASKVDHCNLALRKIGSKTIMSLTDGSTEADLCALMYDFVLDAELRKHPWNFAITEKELAPSTQAPIKDYGSTYVLPSDCIRVEKSPHLYKDYTIQGRKLYTKYETSSVVLRYVNRETNSQLYDPIFSEAFATRLAIEMCEQLTQSTSKKSSLYNDYLDYIRDAKRTNAIEKPFRNRPVGSTLASRITDVQILNN